MREKERRGEKKMLGNVRGEKSEKSEWECVRWQKHEGKMTCKRWGKRGKCEWKTRRKVLEM